MSVELEKLMQANQASSRLEMAPDGIYHTIDGGSSSGRLQLSNPFIDKSDIIRHRDKIKMLTERSEINKQLYSKFPGTTKNIN